MNHLKIGQDNWFKDNPKKPNGEPICTTTEEQYENFLKIMCENNLVIEMDFEDVEEGCGGHIHEIGQFTSEDGSCITYETMECEDIVPSWDEYERGCLEAAVDFFKNFLSDADRKKLRKWVKNHVMPTDIFEECDDYEEIITYFGDYGEDRFIVSAVNSIPIQKNGTSSLENMKMYMDALWKNQ